jgi:hypothetical protein
MQCKRCLIQMLPGRAIEQTWISGISDFIGDTNPICQTMSAGGPGKLIPCLKCPNCGYSVRISG